MEGQIAKFIIPMLKNQTVNYNPHLLILTRVNPGPTETPLIVNFQPITKADQLKESIMPRFHHDRRHFTTAFLLPGDERFYRQNVTFQRIKFDEMIQNAEEKSITKDLNRLCPPSFYCQVCKITYQNYIEHTSSTSHLERLSACQANQYIEELVSKFTNKSRHRRTAVKGKEKAKAKKIEKFSVEVKLFGSKFPKGKQQASCSRTSNQSTNIVQQTIKASSY